MNNVIQMPINKTQSGSLEMKNQMRVSDQSAVVEIPSTKKPMSEAFKKIDAFRNLVHEGSEKILAVDYSYSVYLGVNKSGMPTATGYRGRSKKPSFSYYFPNLGARERKIKSFIQSIETYSAIKKEKEPRALSVGDVLVSSWGYDQTNIDFYLVNKLVGKSSVEIVEIAAIKEFHENDSYRGSCLPDVSNVVGVPFVKRAKGKQVKITSYSYASLHDGKRKYWSSDR